MVRLIIHVEEGVCIYCTPRVFNNFLVYYYVNKCPKDIGLRIIFKNILRKNDKVINFVNNFLYFLSKWYKCLFWMLLLTPQNSKGSKIIASTKKKRKKGIERSFIIFE